MSIGDTETMPTWLTAGPFTASDGEGRVLYENAELVLGEAEAVVLDGPSGCGKSRLLRQLVGLDDAPGGSRRFAGRSFAGRSLPEWRRRVTLLSQDAPMMPGTVADNLELPFRLKAANGRIFDAGRARGLAATVGLERIAFDRPVGTLSGGERHRLALVRGLLWDPPVMVADEPLSGLDPESAAACFDLLLRFARRQGHSAIVVLHDPEVGRAADRQLTLSSGRLEEG